METLYISRLKVDLPSKSRPGHVHMAGTEVAPAGRTHIPHRWLVEIRTKDGDDYWYETLEVGIGDCEVVEILSENYDWEG